MADGSEKKRKQIYSRLSVCCTVLRPPGIGKFESADCHTNYVAAECWDGSLPGRAFTTLSLEGASECKSMPGASMPRPCLKELLDCGDSPADSADDLAGGD